MKFNDYYDKVRACWLGKNIGGTLGAPFESTRGVFDVSYYTHDLSEGVLPNDDLDLQLVWLLAAEKYGRGINAEILCEYWLTYIVADWSEYGAGKNNMRLGLLPPISGRYKNPYGNSNGCFIRSEIWACLNPGHPELAVKYAYEDAITDHTDEGVYAELFCAAVESAAFAESNTQKLINIGLSYIPESCMVAKCIKAVIDCHEKGETWQTARKKVMQLAPSTFGLARGYEDREPEPDIIKGETGYDAPSNIGIMVIGWLYGEGDFSKSLCIAVNCGEDADCTAGTLGSILGIIGGYDSIDKKWLEPIGDEIKTISIDKTKEPLPQTVSELTSRVVRLMPTFMLENVNIDADGIMDLSVSDNMLDTCEQTGLFEFTARSERYKLSPLTVRKENALFEIGISVDDIAIAEGANKAITLKARNKFHLQQWLKIKWHLPNEWHISPSKESCMLLNQYTGGSCLSEKSFTLLPQNLDCGKYEILLEVSSEGRLSKLYIPFVFMNE